MYIGIVLNYMKKKTQLQKFSIVGLCARIFDRWLLQWSFCVYCASISEMCASAYYYLKTLVFYLLFNMKNFIAVYV